MSEYAWRNGGAPSRPPAMFVPVGKSAKLDELIKGIIVQSANDAAISVAENMGGNEGRSPKRMTAEARRLGLKKSVFKNATGFYDPEHQMTVREIAHAGAPYHQEFPEYYPLFSVKEFQYRMHKFINRNPLLGVVAGVDGLKTGFIKEGGHGIVASAKQDNRRLIVGGHRRVHGRGSPGRCAPPAGVGLPQLLRGQAVRRRRDRGPRPRLGRGAHVHAAGRREDVNVGAAALPGQPEGSGRKSSTMAR